VGEGETCDLCRLKPSQHREPRKDKRKGRGTRKRIRGSRGEKEFFLGIDGEGMGREDHRYVMLARAGIGGTHPAEIHAPKGARLTTRRCLNFILDCPRGAKIFAFAFTYDLTHILRDLPDDILFKLLRPELRPDLRPNIPAWQRFPRPVRWKGYRLNMVSRKFVVQKGRKRRVIWDVFAFFQSKFTTALGDWKVGTQEEIEIMARMKNQRADFDQLAVRDVKTYCLDECAKMAELAKKLITAHNDAGLMLRAYYGAGSSASAALKMWKIDKTTRRGPSAMDVPVASAFFGGRFENSVIGVVEGPIYSYDISSAYPYQTAFLPCLECGKWKYQTSEASARSATSALIRYSLPRSPLRSWGPLPFRLDDGCIAYPSASGGGWVWRDEFFAARKLFPMLRFHDAWVYNTRCTHRPFADVPRLYRERLKLGKEGPGLVMKLACNSIYGKLAQSIGENPPFQSWIWAGMVTSGTRAQILNLMSLHKSPDSVLMIATDGIYSRELVKTPKPRDTGTMTEHKKPLGGWEQKTIDGGVFAARPGIYFPVGLAHPPDCKVCAAGATCDVIKSIRARGVGRAAMINQCQRAIDAHKAGLPGIVLANVTRFHGAKSCISKGARSGYKRSADFGQWRTKEIELNFDPMPKREAARKDGSLVLRAFPGMESNAYDPATISMEALGLKLSAAEMQEQPEGDDWTEYETDS
jgi:hypothetical protein